MVSAIGELLRSIHFLKQFSWRQLLRQSRGGRCTAVPIQSAAPRGPQQAPKASTMSLDLYTWKEFRNHRIKEALHATTPLTVSRTNSRLTNLQNTKLPTTMGTAECAERLNNVPESRNNSYRYQKSNLINAQLMVAYRLQLTKCAIIVFAPLRLRPLLL